MNRCFDRSLLGLTILGLSTATGLTQLIVYEDTGGTDFYASVSGGSPPSAAGDLVTLAGGGNTVTSLTAGFRGADILAGATASFSLNFYNPGPLVTVNGLTAPSVGTQIGSTVTLPSVPVQSGNFDVTLSSLNITVPNSVIWAVTIADLTGTGS